MASRTPRRSRRDPHPHVETLHVSSWKGLRELFEGERVRNWAFRGQRDASWSLVNTLARHLERKGIQQRAWNEQEKRIIRIFRRKAHLLLQRTPADFFEWLALMQHHGAPTRLLDFTWSPYVAAFFALDEAEGPAAIWALCVDQLQVRAPLVRRATDERLPPGLVPWNDDGFAEVLLANRHRDVWAGEPFHMNRRLIAQSGTFVVPGVLAPPIDELVAAKSKRGERILQIVLDTARIRPEAVRELYGMNLTHATLFPDLDGLARSMSWELEINWRFDPRSTDEPGN